jgi:thymidine kinase
MTEKLTAVSGSMFAGKTRETIRLVERKRYAGVETIIFKPRIDTRWNKINSVRSHAGDEEEAIAVDSALEILEHVNPNIGLVAIDEVQFFDEGIVEVVEYLIDMDIEVIVAGLPLDFAGRPFGQMPILLAMADEIERLTAVCTYDEDGERCGREATRTQRLVNGKPAGFNDPIVQIGAEEAYAARCPTHHIVPGKPMLKLDKNG